MADETLTQLARAYLEAGGHRVTREEHGEAHFVAATHDDATVLVWVEESARPPMDELSPSQRAASEEREQRLLARFEAEMDAAGPKATGHFLVPRRTGLSRTFTQRAGELLGEHGGVRVPMEFFDAGYLYRPALAEARRRHLAAGRVFQRARKLRRVRQPFFLRTGLEPGERARGGDDLVEHLFAEMTRPGGRACIRLIDGSAGGGKTVAFNALADRLHLHFREAKQRRSATARPIPFNEEHLRGAGPDPDARARIGQLIESVVQIELANAVTREQFEWLLTHGFSTWLFDGLDEVYDGDPNFFPTLAQMVDRDGSQAQILVCTRDSLLGSSQHLRSFVDSRLGQGLPIEVYELAPWNADGWRQAAWIRLEEERPGQENSSRVRAFVEQLERSKILSELAKLPFYCDELLRRAENGHLAADDEFDVMAAIVARMMDREHAKEFFDWSDFATAEDIPMVGRIPEAERREIMAALGATGRQTLIDILEVLAFFRQRAAPDDGPALPVELVRDVLDTHSQTLVSDDPRHTDATIALVQFAFFGMGERADTVDFAHPIIADYLAARYAVKNLRETTSARAVKQSIGRLSVPPSKVFVRYLSHEVKRDPSLRQRLESVLDELSDELGALVRLLLGH